MGQARHANGVRAFRDLQVLQRLAVVADGLDESSCEHQLEPLDLIFQYLELSPCGESVGASALPARSPDDGETATLRNRLRSAYLALQNDVSEARRFKDLARTFVMVERGRALHREKQAIADAVGDCAQSRRNATVGTRDDYLDQLYRDIIEFVDYGAEQPTAPLATKRLVETLRHAAFGRIASKPAGSSRAIDL